MVAAVGRHVRAWAISRQEVMSAGFGWIFVASVDVAMLTFGAVAFAQRPVTDWPTAAVALAIGFSPHALQFVVDITKLEAVLLAVAWTSSTAILLFATSTPVDGDFAPLLLGMSVGVVTAITATVAGIATAAAACALLVWAAAAHRLDTVALYVAIVGICWLVGYLMRKQQQLLVDQRQMQQQLSVLAAADERRRIAREVHDVIAHSLSVTLLHLTAARHTLEHDGDDAAAIEALQQAEQLGRQAMADIRRTVGLLDAGGSATRPEPGIADIQSLADDFAHAGLDVTLRVTGQPAKVSAAAGLVLYRVTQESLANVAKHAPESPVTVSLTITRAGASLAVVNRFPTDPAGPPVAEGRGLPGMQQRIQLIGGSLDAGPCPDGWAVYAAVPAAVAAEPDCPWRAWTP